MKGLKKFSFIPDCLKCVGQLNSQNKLEIIIWRREKFFAIYFLYRYNNSLLHYPKPTQILWWESWNNGDIVSWSVEECRMGFRLQTKMLDCRYNMPSRYKRDLACRACPPNPATGLAGQEEETQDHLEVCRGYSNLWPGLGPLTPLSRVKYFIKLKNRRSKEQSKEQSKKQSKE